MYNKNKIQKYKFFLKQTVATYAELLIMKSPEQICIYVNPGDIIIIHNFVNET